MTSLIAKVAELRELEAKMTRAPWGNCYYHKDSEDDTLTALRNAAPRLLAALGKVQEGDAMLLDWMLQENDGFEEHQWTEELQEQIANMLRRYRDMAQAMEEHR